MKKGTVIGILAALMVGIIVTEQVQLVTAQPVEPNTTEVKGAIVPDKAMPGMGSDCMMMPSKGKWMRGCPMHGMMMKSMMDCQMVATEGSGVIIKTCDKLLKYDKDLNLVKEVEMKVDIEAMKKMMCQMMEVCPMCKKMTEKCEKMEKPAK